MPTPIRQANFNGGEIDPGLWARTNLRRYPESARLLRNMIPMYEGPAVNRPGTLYRHATTSPAFAANARLHPFVFASGTLANNCDLEFTLRTLKIYRGAIELANLITPFNEDEIPRLKFTQIGQRLYIFCKGRSPHILTWVADDTWTLTTMAIERAIVAPTGLAILGTPPPATATQNAIFWEIAVTAVKAETHEESLPSASISATMALSQNTPAQYRWDEVPGAEFYNVYRGRNGLLGYIGQAKDHFFWDDGQGPVYAETPPKNRNPFPGVDDMPQVGTIHDQRLAVANAWNNPGEVEMSRMAELHNFDRGTPPKATDAVTFNVGSQEYEEIRALLSIGRGLLIMTNAQEQMVTGSAGVIQQDDVVFDDQPSRWGISWLDPIRIGPAVVFVQDVGATVREMLPFNKAGSGNDLSLVARHLFRGRHVVSWCYAHEPYRLIWAVLDDGALLSCTYERQTETWAWARHDTGNGDLFESVCSVPEGNESAVYVLVKRFVNGAWRRYREKLAPRVNASNVNGTFLDAAVEYANVGPATLTGLDHLEGREVWAVADGVLRGPFTVTGGSITTSFAAERLLVGLRIVAQGHTLDVFSPNEELRSMKKIVKRVYMEVQDSMPFKAGQRLTDTLQWARRVDGQPWTAPYTGLVEININADWDTGGAVVWEQQDAFPLTVMSVIREVEFGGR